MNNKQKRYLDYSNNIPYAPNINKYGNGGLSITAPNSEESTIGTPENTINSSLVAGVSIPSYLIDIPAPPTTGINLDLKLDHGTNHDYSTLSFIGNQVAKGLSNLAALQLHNRELELKRLMQQVLNIAEGRAALVDFNNTIRQNKLNSIYGKDSLEDPNKFMIGGLISAGIAVDSAAGKLIGGNYSSGVGNALLALPGGGIIGGTINRLFGESVNEAEKARVRMDETALKNKSMNIAAASDFDSLALNNIESINSKVNVYKGGIASKGKAAAKNAALQALLLLELENAYNARANTVSNLLNLQMTDFLRNEAAGGGQLNIKKNSEIDISPEKYVELLNLGYELEII